MQYGIEAPPGLSRWNQAGIKALSALEISPDLRYMLICSDHGFEADRREHDPYGFYLIRSERFSGGRKDIPITGIAPSILKILGLDDELGVPVARDKVEIKTGKLKEIKQRLKALGYI